MGARTVTFAIQLGSGGGDVARLVAERLGYRYYDWEVTSQAASEAGVSLQTIEAAERTPTLLETIMARLLASGLHPQGAGIGRLSPQTMASAIEMLRSRDYRAFVEKVVLELTEHGEAVIVGHAGQVVLAGRPEVLKVLVCGSAGARAGRLAADEGLSLEEARVFVEDSDADRKGFFRKIYGVELLDGSLYDIVLNTDRLSPQRAAELVVAAAAMLAAGGGAGDGS